MYCPKCGKELPEGAQFCPTCGSSINQPEFSPQSQDSSSPDQDIPSINLQSAAAEQQNQPPVPNEEIKCPKCGASGCVPQYKQNVSGGGYGCCSGGLGALVLGPLGLLCGACGRSVKSTNTLVWICPKCGHEFRVVSSKEIYSNILLSMLSGLLSIFLFCSSISARMARNYPHMFLMGILGIIGCLGSAVYIIFTLPKTPLEHLTEEQKQGLKKAAIIMGGLSILCLLLRIII